MNWFNPTKEANMDEVHIPEVAEMPTIRPGSSVTVKPANGPVDLSHVAEADIYHQAAVRAMEHETYKEKSKQLIQEASDHIKTLAREIEFLKLELSLRDSTVQIQQSEMSDLRQENSDLRAVLSEYLAQFKYMVARLEQKEIQPLEPRRSHKKKKEPTDMKSLVLESLRGNQQELAGNLQAVEPKKDENTSDISG